MKDSEEFAAQDQIDISMFQAIDLTTVSDDVLSEMSKQIHDEICRRSEESETDKVSPTFIEMFGDVGQQLEDLSIESDTWNKDMDKRQAITDERSPF
jgi:hypothetical protein